MGWGGRLVHVSRDSRADGRRRRRRRRKGIRRENL
jgi:hypothetical protein